MDADKLSKKKSRKAFQHEHQFFFYCNDIDSEPNFCLPYTKTFDPSIPALYKGFLAVDIYETRGEAEAKIQAKRTSIPTQKTSSCKLSDVELLEKQQIRIKKANDKKMKNQAKVTNSTYLMDEVLTSEKSNENPPVIFSPKSLFASSPDKITTSVSSLENDPSVHLLATPLEEISPAEFSIENNPSIHLPSKSSLALPLATIATSDNNTSEINSPSSPNTPGRNIIFDKSDELDALQRKYDNLQRKCTKLEGKLEKIERNSDVLLQQNMKLQQRLVNCKCECLKFPPGDRVTDRQKLHPEKYLDATQELLIKRFILPLQQTKLINEMVDMLFTKAELDSNTGANLDPNKMKFICDYIHYAFGSVVPQSEVVLRANKKRNNTPYKRKSSTAEKSSKKMKSNSEEIPSTNLPSPATLSTTKSESSVGTELESPSATPKRSTVTPQPYSSTLEFYDNSVITVADYIHNEISLNPDEIVLSFRQL